MTQEQKQERFIKKANDKYKGKFDYSKVEYVDTETKVCIVCPEHGEFFQSPQTHLSTKHGCPQCGLESITRLSTTEEFIKKAQEIYGNEYDYSKTRYINCHTKVCVTCKKHGDFYILPTNHVGESRKQGCQKCAIENSVKKQHIQAIDSFINKAKTIHGNKYDYSNINYKNIFTPITLTCKEHGEFEITPQKHLSGKSCPICDELNKKESLTKSFIDKAIKIHGNNFDYTNTKYIDSKTKVCITCPKHGDFYVYPDTHLAGGGLCPACYKEEHNIYSFDECYAIAKQCKTRLELKNKNIHVYNKCARMDWWKEFNWLIPYDNKLKSQFIYVYEFPNNVAYVGLTNDIKRRNAEHTGNYGKRSLKSPVFNYSKKENIETPEIKILESELTRSESKERECFWIDYYKNNGWMLLNKVKGGSLGGSLLCNEITNEEIIAFAKTCKTKQEMRSKNRSLYNHMCKRKLQKTCFPNGILIENMIKRKYTDDYILSEVNKYEYKKDLRNTDPTFYHFLWKKHKLDYFFEKNTGKNFFKK